MRTKPFSETGNANLWHKAFSEFTCQIELICYTFFHKIKSNKNKAIQRDRECKSMALGI